MILPSPAAIQFLHLDLLQLLNVGSSNQFKLQVASGEEVIIASKTKRVRVIVREPMIQVKVNTVKAGYYVAFEEVLHTANPEAFNQTLRKAATFALEALNKTPPLPEPWLFSNIKYHIDGLSVESHVVFGRVEVLGLVAVGDDRSVSVDKISTPDAICWYFLDCVGIQGATFNIISDGEVFYPVSRVTSFLHKVETGQPLKCRLATGPNKKSVDLSAASRNDQLLVQKAIELYMKETFK